MPCISVGRENSSDIRIHYEDHGNEKGEPVVLIHGFPYSGVAWEKQIYPLLDAGYRVIAYDRRGFGKSSQPAIGYDYDTFAADLDQLMTHLDLHDATLVGHSMGTGESIRYLSRYGSKRVNRAMLISVIGPFLLKTPDNPDALDQSAFESFRRAILADRPAFMTQFCKDFFSYDANRGKSVSEEEFRASWNLAVSASPKGTYECVQAWATDFRKDLPRIDVPVLIIHGTDDHVLPYPLTAVKAKPLVKNCRLVTVDNGPHSLPWTHADLINRELLAFIRQEKRKSAAA